MFRDCRGLELFYYNGFKQAYREAFTAMGTYFLIDFVGFFSAAINGVCRASCGANRASGAFMWVYLIY